MSRKELIDLLKTRKGYQKKGVKWLSENFNINVRIVKECLAIAKETDEPAFAIAVSTPSIKENNIIKIDKPGSYWITGCCHAPWQNKAMYDSTINYLQKEVGLEGIILAGDVLDINSLSRHDKGNIPIKEVTLDWEYKEANKFINIIDELKADNKIFLYGNHEDRYLRHLKTIDASKYGEALASPEEALKLESRGYQVLKNFKDDAILIGRYLEVNHGEFCNVHTAKKTIDTYRKSVLYFHTHRFQIYMEGQVAGFNMGFGGNINAPIFNYATRAMKTSWNNASALVTLDTNGLYHVQPLLYMGNKLIINGKQY